MNIRIIFFEKGRYCALGYASIGAHKTQPYIISMLHVITITLSEEEDIYFPVIRI